MSSGLNEQKTAMCIYVCLSLSNNFFYVSNCYCHLLQENLVLAEAEADHDIGCLLSAPHPLIRNLTHSGQLCFFGQVDAYFDPCEFCFLHRKYEA